MPDKAEFIFYDRPESSGSRFSRYQILPVADPAAAKSLLAAALGLRGVVAKRRELYLWNESRIHLDEVEGLGTFIEFEVLSRGDEADDRARMASLLGAFELDEAEALSCSYSDLSGP